MQALLFSEVVAGFPSCLSFLTCSVYQAEQLGGTVKLLCYVDAFVEERAGEHRLTGSIVLPGRSNLTPNPNT